MISLDQIKTLAKKLQTTEINVRREYFQHLFLSYFYQQTQTDKVFFKGGTALRFLYNSPRFSEDLDFSAIAIEIDDIEKGLLQTFSEIEREGVTISLEEAKKTSGGYLSSIAFKAYGQSTDILLEISLRDDKKKGEVVTVVNDFIPTYLLSALLKDQLVEEKIKALLFRKKPRDFYDFYFILRANLLPVSRRDILSQILKTLKESDINFEHELKIFLPKSHWPIIRDFKAVLGREIERFV